jgi:pimeloyl-[acyl-carrier protein] methyl ester esterase
VSVRLHVESTGAGPPLVLLHGWAMHSGMWGSVAAALAPRFRVHAVDLPGHGYSAAVAPWTLDAAADAVAAAVAAKLAGNEAPLTVVGWSLGGAVALRWALAAPRRIGRLALVCATPCFVARPGWPDAMAAATLAQFGDELRVAYRLTLQRFLSLQLRGGDDAKGTLAAMRARLFARPDPAPAVLAQALAALAATDLRAAVPEIRQPALVVAGERDTLVPCAAGAWLAQAMPHARYTAIAGAAHAPHLSHPAAFAAALDGFLDDPAEPARAG